MRSLRLRTKFMFVVFGMAAFIGVVLTIFVQTYVSGKLSSEFLKRGAVLAEHAASMNANSILTGDFRSVQINIIDLKNENKESVEYIFILDRNRKVIAHTFEELAPLNLISANNVPVGKNLSIQPIIAGEKHIEDIAINLSLNQLLEVHVGMKDEVIRRGVNEITFWILAVILSVLVVCFIAATIFSLGITREISNLASAALKIEGGDLSINMEVKGYDEISELKRAMNRMAATLKELIGKTQTRNTELEEWQRNELWFKSGLNDLNVLLRGNQRIAEVADKTLSFVISYLGGGTGVFYQYDEKDESLHSIATYAISNTKRLDGRVQLGEGLVGQVALEKKMICLDSIPHHYLSVSSVMGEAEPLNIVIVPIMFDDVLTGVLEIGSFIKFSENDFCFLNQASEGIAIALNVNRSRQLVDELLEETQSQTEELRVQQEELYQTNEELKERALLMAEQNNSRNQDDKR